MTDLAPEVRAELRRLAVALIEYDPSDTEYWDEHDGRRICDGQCTSFSRVIHPYIMAVKPDAIITLLDIADDRGRLAKRCEELEKAAGAYGRNWSAQVRTTGKLIDELSTLADIEAERDDLRRKLAVAVEALEDVARWVGGMCSCPADDQYRDKPLSALTTIKEPSNG